MRLKSPERKHSEENLVPLINIVFLILIFFLVASTIRPFTDREVKLAETVEASKSAAVPRMLIIRADGTRLAASGGLDDAALREQLAQWAAQNAEAITVVADKETDAAKLIEAVTLANAAGIADVKLLTRKAR